MLDSRPLNIFLGDFATNVASFTTAGPLNIQLKGLVAFICQYGPKKPCTLSEKGLYARSGPWWPTIRPFLGIFDHKIGFYGQKDI